MLQLSVTSAVLAASLFIVALYELTNIWWAVLACSFALAAVAYVTGHAADAAAQPQAQHQREVR